jgi:hypothetical protein
MNLKRKIFGGAESNIGHLKQMEKFMAIIIMGYFGIKIVFGGMFGFYPEKYYYRNIQVSTNDNSCEENISQNVTINGYIPGMWNNELTDFVSMLVLCYVVFVFTNFWNKTCIDQHGNLNFLFLFGYLLGLSYPIYKALYLNKYYTFVQQNLQNLNYYLFALFFIFICAINLVSIGEETNTNNRVNYITFVVAIILVLTGLVATRKKTEDYSLVTYFNSDGTNCSTKSTDTNSIVQMSGDKINLTFPFVAFILLLLFSYEPDNISMKSLFLFLYGLFLGVLVSNISYYGIEYFLKKVPTQQCNSPSECGLKGIGDPVSEEEDNSNSSNVIILNPNLKNTFSYQMKQYISKISVVKLMLIISIIFVFIYLLYFYLKK